MVTLTNQSPQRITASNSTRRITASNSTRLYKMRYWFTVASLVFVSIFHDSATLRSQYSLDPEDTSVDDLNLSRDTSSLHDTNETSLYADFSNDTTLDSDSSIDDTEAFDIDSISYNDTTTWSTELLSEEIIIRHDLAPEGWSDVKLAIYMTTHLPDEHIAFLPCWNDAIQRLNIFEYADLIIFTAADVAPEHLALLPFRSVTIKNYTNPGYQEGAIQAMVEPFLDNITWFDEYDWVVRVNPDVLIRDDTWLMDTMLNTSIEAILHECTNETYTLSPFLHSDFYAFRPKALDRVKVLETVRDHAELHITNVFREIYDARRFVFVEGAFNSLSGTCRIEGEKSPVVHVHELSNFCPNYYNITREGFYR